MKDFAFLHQDTPKGQILIQNDYDPHTDQYKIEIKFMSSKVGATLDMSMCVKNEAEADGIFNDLKNLDTVIGFIEEAIPYH